MDTYDDRRRPRPLAAVAAIALIGLGSWAYLKEGPAAPPPGVGSPVAAATVAPTSTSPGIAGAADATSPAHSPGTTTTTPDATTRAEPDADAPTDTTSSTSPSPSPSPFTPAREAGTAVVTDEQPASLPADTGLESGPSDVTTAVAGDDTTRLPDLGFPAAPDGSPLPVVATYDVGVATLTGHVPSESARDRLIALAAANAQDEAEVVDRLIVNELVPANVGVRVIEMNSARFPEGAAQVTPEHAEQLDRAVMLLQALPHVTVLVIGHADQRGDDDTNLALSNERAGAVVDHLVYLGIEPTRISSRAAGESDLLTLDDDAAALALNRRTEFVFYGVLAG